MKFERVRVLCFLSSGSIDLCLTYTHIAYFEHVPERFGYRQWPRAAVLNGGCQNTLVAAPLFDNVRVRDRRIDLLWVLTPALPFDGNAGYGNWMVEWSVAEEARAYGSLL